MSRGRARRFVGARMNPDLASTAARQHIDQLLERISDAFYALDPDFRFTYLNAEAERILGRPRRELLGRVVWEAFPPAVETPLYPALQQARAENRTATVEFFYPPFDGWYEVRAYPAPSGLSVFFRDVTASRRHQQELRASENRYRALVERLPAVVYLLAADENQTPLYYSPNIRALTGESPEELLGLQHHWLDRIHPADRERVAAEETRSTAADDAFRIEYRHRRTDGSYVWVRDECVPIHDDAGHTVAWQGMLLDVSERVQAEEAQVRLATVVASSPEAIIGTTLEGTITSWNPAAERLYGYTTAEAIGTSVTVLIPPGLSGDLAPLLERVRRGERIEGHETARTTKDGRQIDISLALSPIRDASGRIVAVSSVARDITEQREAQQALAREHTLLRALLENLPDAVYIKDAASRFLRLNQATAGELGIADPAAAVGKTDLDFFPPALAAEYLADEQRLLATGEPMLSKFERQQTAAGEERWVLASKTPLRDADGNVTGLVGVNRDITEQWKQQIEMARLASIVESSSDAILSKTLDGIITSWNPAAERLYGYTAAEAVGRSIEMLIPAGEANDIPAILARIRAGERIEHYDARRQTRDGRVLDIALTVSPIRDSHGIVVGASTIARDVTALRRLQAERDRLHAEREAEILRTAEIQAQLLPRAAPPLEGYELAGVCLPAREVGGDFFDWTATEAGVRLSLGDVMGKGMPASLLMATVRAALRAVGRLPISAAVETVNRALYADLAESDSFITLFHADLDIATGVLSYVDAGHGMAFRQRSDGRAESLRQGALPVGVLPDGAYPEGAITLAPGDTLVIYSDGLPDARPELPLDTDRVAEQIAGLGSAQAKLERLVELATGTQSRPDDLTLVVVRRLDDAGPARRGRSRPSLRPENPSR